MPAAADSSMPPAKHAWRNCWLEIAGVLAGCAVLTVVLVKLDADLRLARKFYDAAKGGWYMGGQPPWSGLYHYGEWPAVALAVGGLLAAGYFWRRKQARWRSAALLPLLLILGPGLVVNVVFKENWGRPRPRQLAEFGGAQIGKPESYAPPWQPGTSGEGRFSFPSGHASMGFFLLAPFFALRRRQPLAARLVLIGGVWAGLIVGFARITQGGHFLTDVIWSGAFIFVCGRWLQQVLRLEEVG